MGRYLDQLHSEFDELTTGITATIDRAADESRDVSDTEQEQIDRDHKRAGELEAAIKHYTDIEVQGSRVAGMRGQVATAPRTTNAAPSSPEQTYDILREFPTPGDYAAALHRAWVNKDKDALAAIERATAHQTTVDNPGIIPRPIVGPLIDTMGSTRPLINSFGVRPAPTWKFDRPRVTQHVEIAKQAVEKDLTASQEMLIDSLPVTLETYAGHLNISKQDIRWTQPSILQAVFDDFTRIYARRTDGNVCAEFPPLITQTAPLASYDPAEVDAWLREAVATVISGAPDVLINAVWMSLDVWAGLGGAQYAMGNKAFNLPLTGSGDVLGLRAVIDPQLADGTLIAGDAAQAEVWEDLEGFMSVDEPSVLGQLVGYAGYLDFVVLQPSAFVKASGLPPVTP